MIAFALIFLTLSGLIHDLVFRGMPPLLSNHPALPRLVWMGVMIVAPVLVRLLDRSGYPAAAGSWGPPVRILAPPETTLLEIIAAERGLRGRILRVGAGEPGDAMTCRIRN